MVEDLGGANGTLVNGQPIRFRTIKRGDEITVGDTRLRLFSRR